MYYLIISEWAFNEGKNVSNNIDDTEFFIVFYFL